VLEYRRILGIEQSLFRGIFAHLRRCAIRGWCEHDYPRGGGHTLDCEEEQGGAQVCSAPTPKPPSNRSRVRCKGKYEQVTLRKWVAETYHFSGIDTHL